MGAAKTRIVVDGSKEKPGIDYDDSGALDVGQPDPKALRFLVAHATVQDFVYVVGPPQMYPPHTNPRTHALELHGAVYGLHVSGLLWAKRVREVMTSGLSKLITLEVFSVTTRIRYETWRWHL